MRHLILAVATLAAASACTPLRSHQGYIIDADLVNSVRPGIDNRQSVLATLGSPSFAAQFNQGDWYYVARDSRNYAFNSPRVRDQLVLQISFDPQGNVATIRKSGVDQVAKVDPYGKITPTLGRKRGFFQDLFGNIGAVGAAGTGAGAGGGRDQP
jgi:outer membrane protein assembly factor BamE (lipoprotein component of BamABCDE complex)